MVAKFAEDYFRQVGHRFPAPELIGKVADMGIEIKGEKPINTLASILSANPSFNNVRGKGYGLAEWGNGDGPNGSSTMPADLPWSGSQQHPVIADGPGMFGPDPEANATTAEDYSIADDDGRITTERVA